MVDKHKIPQLELAALHLFPEMRSPPPSPSVDFRYTDTFPAKYVPPTQTRAHVIANMCFIPVAYRALSIIGSQRKSGTFRLPLFRTPSENCPSSDGSVRDKEDEEARKPNDT